MPRCAVQISVTALDPLQGTDNVAVMLLAPGGSPSSAPLLQATIKMPVSEPEDI
jgi:Bardet-Biedl syndrome 1 protein